MGGVAEGASGAHRRDLSLKNKKPNRGSAMKKPAAGNWTKLRTATLLYAAMTFATAHAQTLEVPARSVPVPTTVSPQLAKIIGAPLRTNWNVLPKTGEEWKPVAD